jgi:hypothetical protein
VGERFLMMKQDFDRMAIDGLQNLTGAGKVFKDQTRKVLVSV